MPKRSQVIELLDLVWQNANSATSFSWERLNHSMRSALGLTICSGFEFAEDDIQYVMKNYRSGRWIGACDEWIYRDAILVGNMSAIKSFEKYRGREPFIADDVTIGMFRGDFQGVASDRKRERLAVGFGFSYRGFRLKVNSFAKDGSYINCATYKKAKRPDGYDTEKIDKRFKITVADIQAERKERKQNRKAGA